jgi:hypothetical protein
MREREGEGFRVAIDGDIAVLAWLALPTPAIAPVALEAAARQRGFARGMPLLILDTGEDTNAPTDELRQYARLLAVYQGTFGCFAIVVASELSYGLARLMGAYAEALGASLMIAKSPQEAKAALRSAMTLAKSA